jgi:CRISPR-associated protein Csb1
MPESAKFNFTKFDELLDPKGPVMIAGRQLLKIAAISCDDIVFPPSYAHPSEKPDDPPVYNIDSLDPADPSKNVCVLDSIPSQANRMEPLFGMPEHAHLVPQYSVKIIDDAPPVSILSVGHRLADALFRGTTLRDEIVTAFKQYSRGNACPIARLGPTSLVFGVWDSRGTGIKVPRLINSIVRASNVSPLKRSAQYSPPIKYEQEGLIPAGLDGKPSDHGLADVPSTHTLGGVQIHGEIRRDFSLNLATLRTLKGTNDDETKSLQRYILGLALLAFTAAQDSTLRQGCQLLPKGKPAWKRFFANGDESEWDPESHEIREFASAAAVDFCVPQPTSQPLIFDKTLLKASIDADGKKKAEKKARNTGDPLETLRKLVGELDFIKGDKFKEAKNSAFTKLRVAIEKIEGDSGSSDDLKELAGRLKSLASAEPGAAQRKEQMFALFPAAPTPQHRADSGPGTPEETPK